MDKIKLKEELTLYHTNFINSIQSLPKEQWQISYNNKWSAAQQLDHIIKSVSPVKLAFSLPKFLLKLVFGKANRKSRSYDELVTKYHEKLKAGGKASARFVPPPRIDSAESLSTKLAEVTHSLATKINSFSEEQLDLLILPHPLLGKLTLREMLYFTIYHVQHHQKQLNP
ncbi:MAG: DinB family protein [Cyclobacteriaceae bacterium]